ncbi:MAG: ABC transporter permease [Aigarchaeota archaeon]|nr:ABC transporter permease [Aigarchaeota archaeon]MCX8193277.1 ABC transporter permease [Nitrososphaeria archaeon]MDW7987041.1 ABC transporter permease [Nitrososphaerota archaeon]
MKEKQSGFNLKQNMLLFMLENAVWPLFIAIYLILGVIQPVIFSPTFFMYILYLSVPLGFAILGQTICLIGGVLDLSIGSLVGFSAMIAGVILKDFYGIPPHLSFALPIIFGLLCGSFNGYFTGFLRLNPFIVTLATMMAFQGLKIIVARGFTIPGSYLPEIYLFPGSNVTFSIISFIVTVVLVWIFLRYTRPGIHIYVVGGNQDVAHMMGVDPKKMIFLIFSISGVFAGISGLYYTGFNRSVPITLGNEVLFPTFAAAIISGVSLRGGRGNILNVVGGALLLGVIEAFLVTYAVSPEARIVGYGFMVLIAVLFNQFRDNVRDSILRRI